jgi:hypothetical protein
MIHGTLVGSDGDELKVEKFVENKLAYRRSLNFSILSPPRAECGAVATT